MRINKAFGFIPEGILLLQAIFPDVHELGGLIAAFAALKYRDEKLPQGEASGRELRLLPGL